MSMTDLRAKIPGIHRLLAGFDNLSILPRGSLVQYNRTLPRPDTPAQAWTKVSNAMWSAMSSLDQPTNRPHNPDQAS